jgi:hypothetical protein
MLEILFILFILFFFILPRAALACVLGIGTVACIARAVELWNHQPSAGKLLLKIRAISVLFNFLMSVATASILSVMIHFLILENRYLFLFNFVFCFFISLRWFDYSQYFYRLAVLRFFDLKVPVVSPSAFVVCEGSKSNYVFGRMYVPVFFDAGFLYSEGNQFVFKGVLGEYRYGSCDLIEIFKRSSDTIRLIPRADKCPFNSKILDFKFKDRFYPFKSRHDRDKIIDSLSETGVSHSSASLK